MKSSTWLILSGGRERIFSRIVCSGALSWLLIFLFPSCSMHSEFVRLLLGEKCLQHSCDYSLFFIPCLDHSRLVVRNGWPQENRASMESPISIFIVFSPAARVKLMIRRKLVDLLLGWILEHVGEQTIRPPPLEPKISPPDLSRAEVVDYIPDLEAWAQYHECEASSSIHSPWQRNVSFWCGMYMASMKCFWKSFSRVSSTYSTRRATRDASTRFSRSRRAILAPSPAALPIAKI